MLLVDECLAPNLRFVIFILHKMLQLASMELPVFLNRNRFAIRVPIFTLLLAAAL